MQDKISQNQLGSSKTDKIQRKKLCLRGMRREYKKHQFKSKNKRKQARHCR